MQDIIDDDAETVIITASNGTSTIGSATITITDDDAAPVMEFTLSPDSVAEAAGTSRVTVGTGTGSTFATDQAITLTVSGTAAEIGDYTIGSKSLTLPAAPAPRPRPSPPPSRRCRTGSTTMPRRW